MNNWEKAGFESAEKAMLYAIALTMKTVPGATVTWKNHYWTKEDFNKETLSAVKELV